MATMSTMAADPDTLDQRVRLYDVSWDDYRRLLTMRGEKSVPRITYLEGEVELMSPSQHHEWIGKTIARLVEAFSEERGLDLIGFGRWTVKKRTQQRGLEPDECYILGTEKKKRPDLAIEVVWTSGGIAKLEVYRGLGVPEVWFWQNGRLTIHVLRRGGYQKVARSALLPDLDPAQLVHFVRQSNQARAVRDYRRMLREGRAG